jgi:molybdopterin converting factor small subunit
MKVNLQVVGLTTIFEALRRNEKIEVEFPGKTVQELIDALVAEFGTNVRKALLNENGDFNAGIRVLLNGVIYPVETIMRAILKQGDTLIFQAPS